MSTVKIIKRTYQYGSLFHVGQTITCDDSEAQRLIGLRVAVDGSTVQYGNVSSQIIEDTFSILLPFRDGDTDIYRCRNFNWCVARWKALCPNAEILIDYDEVDGSFWESRCINKGARRASSEILFITGSDLIADAGQIRAALALLRSGVPWVHPFSRTVRLNDRMSQRIVEGDCMELPPINFADCDNLERGIYEHNHTDDGSYQTVIRRADFLAVGGWDERFRGWGHNDIAFARAANTLLGEEVRVQHTLIHLYHQYYGDNNRTTMPNELKEHDLNKQIGEEYVAANRNPDRMRELVKDRAIHVLPLIDFTTTEREWCDVYRQVASSLVHYLPDGKVYVEAGANIGYFASMIRDQRPTTTMVLFEPQLQCFQRCTDRFFYDKQVTTYQCGLSDHNEQLVIHCDDTRPLLNTFHCAEYVHSNPAFENVAELKTLDSFGFDNVGLIKIDAEGWDWRIVLGAMETIARSKPAIYIEDCTNDGYVNHGIHELSYKQEAMQKLLDLGYREIPCVDPRNETNMLLVSDDMAVNNGDGE